VGALKWPDLPEEELKRLDAFLFLNTNEEYGCGYWDGFVVGKIDCADIEKEEWIRKGVWEDYLLGIQDGIGDREEYETSKP